MKLDKHYESRTDEEIRDDQMQEEIEEITKWLKKYTYNIDSLHLERSKEVKKAMINYLVEQL